ncbi:hypothetical protein [Streptomyces sp. B6B3]|uniref:hypothetical protein n=1 Tax=Streptomyces sp. B6B3 TaxID=3153570 RepID=UPI00325C9CE0
MDRIALAIELVAPRVATTPLPTVARQLSTRGALPDALHAAIDWSYRLLTDEERAVLRAVSVLVAPFTPDAAAAVAERPGTAEALARLADRSLLADRTAFAAMKAAFAGVSGCLDRLECPVHLAVANDRGPAVPPWPATSACCRRRRLGRKPRDPRPGSSPAGW